MLGRSALMWHLCNVNIWTQHRNQGWDIILIRSLLMVSILLWHTKNIHFASKFVSISCKNILVSFISYQSGVQTKLY